MKHQLKENAERKIKKNIYGKPQAAKLIFPPGLGTIALQEIKYIISNLWFTQKYPSEFSLLKNEIRINNIHLFAITELLARSQCLTDIRLIIFEGKAVGKEAFEKQCRNIDWNLYISASMSIKVKINSVASKAFHETALKEILSDLLKKDHIKIVSGENANETTCIYADLYKDNLTISISLAGSPLYKRGYRGTLSASAPLQEDAASCCIQKSLLFAKELNKNFLPNTILIPFSGTGTFAFEYLQSFFNFAPILFEREYALQQMPLFRQEHFNFILKKATENCLFNSNINNNHNTHFICIDNSKNANSALVQNATIFKNAVLKHALLFPDKLFSQISDDFIDIDIIKIITAESKNSGNIFIPLNPPYGVRLRKHSNAITLYKNIANKINELSKLTKKEHKNILGFILCPNEDTWSIFCEYLIDFKTETYHFTQGGLDIRVCQFYI